MAVERYLTGAGIAKSSARIYRISLTTWGWMLASKPAPTGPARRGAKPPVFPVTGIDDPALPETLAELAVDLAETRLPQIRDLMAALADAHDGSTIRVLLLARGHDTWWPALRRHLRTRRLGPAEDAFTLTPDDALEGHSPEDIYLEAKVAFACRIWQVEFPDLGITTFRKVVAGSAKRNGTVPDGSPGA